MLDIAYQSIPSKNPAWFLQKATCRTFNPGVAQTPNTKGWNEIEVINVRELKLLSDNDMPKNFFELDLPKGTAVHDNIEKKTRRIGHIDMNDVNKGRSVKNRLVSIRVIGFIICTILIVVLVIVRFSQKWRRNRLM